VSTIELFFDLVFVLPPDRLGRQVLLVCAMAAFLVCALAIPEAFDETGVVFGIGYLCVVLAHSALFATGSGPFSAAISMRSSPCCWASSASRPGSRSHWVIQRTTGDPGGAAGGCGRCGGRNRCGRSAGLSGRRADRPVA